MGKERYYIDVELEEDVLTSGMISLDLTDEELNGIKKYLMAIHEREGYGVYIENDEDEVILNEGMHL